MVTLTQQNITLMELADGTRRNNVALKRGDAEVSTADEMENM